MNPFAANALPDAELADRKRLQDQARAGNVRAGVQLWARYKLRVFSPAECRAEEARYNAGHPATTRDDVKRGELMGNSYSTCETCGKKVANRVIRAHRETFGQPAVTAQDAPQKPITPEQTLPQPTTADRPATGKRNGNGHDLVTVSQSITVTLMNQSEGAYFTSLIRRGLDLDGATASIEQARRVYGARP